MSVATVKGKDGEITYDGNGHDRKPSEKPDVQVGQMWLRVLERRAKLYGLDLERSVGPTGAVTAEMLAELLGYDGAEPPIDVEGEELTDDRESRELGAGG